jgi:ABC-type polysaccharide/polyol phosphate export permease
METILIIYFLSLITTLSIGLWAFWGTSVTYGEIAKLVVIAIIPVFNSGFVLCFVWLTIRDSAIWSKPVFRKRE